MATITLTIPDPVLNRVLDAIANSKGYGSGGGQTKAQFAKAVVAAYVKSIVVEYESRAAADTAFKTAATTADSDISVT